MASNRSLGHASHVALHAPRDGVDGSLRFAEVVRMLMSALSYYRWRLPGIVLDTFAWRRLAVDIKGQQVSTLADFMEKSGAMRVMRHKGGPYRTCPQHVVPQGDSFEVESPTP